MNKGTKGLWELTLNCSNIGKKEERNSLLS